MSLFGATVDLPADEALAEWRARFGDRENWKRADLVDQVQGLITEGMGKDEVLAKLGEPNAASDTELMYLTDDDVFANYKMLVVFFDASGQVLKTEQTDSRTYKGP